MKLTDEQLDVIATADDDQHLKVEALAGTGKTTTMRCLAERSPRSTLYVAFNRAIVDEARDTMPRGTRCSTVHSLAYRAIGDPWVSRTHLPRIKSTEIARRYGLETIWLNIGGRNKRIAAGFLGGLVTRSLQRFARSADARPGPHHVPIPRSARHDPDMLLMYREIRALVVPKLPKAWSDMIAPDSDLPLDGNMVIKMWQLSGPTLPYDRIIVDEAQDMNDAARAVLEAQMPRSQLVAVGDTWQQINAWNGAVNALDKFPIERRRWLTHSFRFGPEIAETANIVLRDLGSEKLISGRGPAGRVAPLAEPSVRLSRTNALAVSVALDELEAGRRPHIIGGSSDVTKFCEGVLDLQNGRPVTHPELMCFDSWADVLAYVATDELGGDLRPLVHLVLKFGAETIVETMRSQPDERSADVVLSTTHKVKGRQWPSVQLAEDFPESIASPVEDVRLLYVAVTRAQTALDVVEVPYFPQHTKQLTGETTDDISDESDAATETEHTDTGSAVDPGSDRPVAAVRSAAGAADPH